MLRQYQSTGVDHYPERKPEIDESSILVLYCSMSLLLFSCLGQICVCNPLGRPVQAEAEVFTETVADALPDLFVEYEWKA